MSLNTSKTEWDLSPLYRSDNDSQMQTDRKVVEKINYDFINKWKNRTDYLEDPKVLRDALDELEIINSDYGSEGKEGYYWWLRTHQDQVNPNLKAKEAKIDDFGRKIQNDSVFFALNLAKISLSNQKKFLDSDELKPYRHFLERIFAEAPHLLTEPEEKVLTLTGRSAFSNWVKMTEEFISRETRKAKSNEGEKEQTFEELLSGINDIDKTIRDSAAAGINNILNQQADVAVKELNSVLEYKKVTDELRGFDRPDASRHLEDDIDSEIVDTLLESVSKRNDIARRFYQLKAQLLGQPKLAYHERNVPIGEFDKKYSYSDAVDLVYKVLTNLDSEFGVIFKTFVESGQIDVFPRKGKHGGAFCVGVHKSMPVYVLLNHTGQLREVSTVAHEMGHGINDVLISRSQNSLNYGTYLSTAEVASTFMEDFVFDDLTKEVDDELRLAMQMQKLNDDISTIFRQVAAYQFEQDLHREYRTKGYLSREDIGELFVQRMSGYMGNYVEQPESAKDWWVSWSHIRRYFYVYSYASGLLISKSLQASVKADNKFINKVKDFLSAGLSDSPANILAKAGVDITDPKFWEKGLDEVEQLLADTEALAKKLGKFH